MTEAPQPLGEVSGNRKQECKSCNKQRVIKKEGKCNRCCTQGKSNAERGLSKRRYSKKDWITTIEEDVHFPS
jgi:hypothetical protein